MHDFGRDLLAALQHLHSKGIIHCDLKPSNVLLDENGAIKLGGFSAARRLADIGNVPVSNVSPVRGAVETASAAAAAAAAAAARAIIARPVATSWNPPPVRLAVRTQAGRGTPSYMAPELFDQDCATHSTASDLWAFGCMLYQCFCGRPPFINTSFHELVRTILHTDPAPMPNASNEFVDLVGRLLDKNPATRITWLEMQTHPFWQFTLTALAMPEEPALQRYIERHGMAPSHQALPAAAHEEASRASTQAQRCGLERAALASTRGRLW